MLYNHHFSNHFGSCRLLGKGHDPHRDRNVEFRAIPGVFDCIGISDGVDAWVAPINTPFLSNIKRVLDALQAGKDPAPFLPVQRKRVALEEETPPLTRRRVTLDDEPEARPRTRRHLLA